MADTYNEGSYFGNTLGVPQERSKFNIVDRRTFSASVGALYPFYLSENIPSDVFHLKTALSAIMQPSVYPTMDDIVCDVAYFSVPFRLIWDDFKKFMGETEPSDYDESNEMVMPYFLIPGQPTGSAATSNSILVGDILDQFGCQPGVNPSYLNSLAYRAYRLIWNEWYRNTALQDSLLINKGAVDTEYIPYLLRVNRFKDYFTSALPSPQIGSEGVIIPITEGLANVFPSNVDYDEVAAAYAGTFSDSLRMASIDGSTFDLVSNTAYGGMHHREFGVALNESSAFPGGPSVVPYNLTVDFTNQINAVGSTVTALRQAVATQRYLETLNRGGRRYREQLKAFFGTESPDASQQVPEYLGGARFNISMSANVQTSSNSADQALGSLSGVSITKVKSFDAIPHVYTEHCLTIGVMSFRVLNHTYQQGAPRFFFKKSKFDLYNPLFSRISEQPIYAGEIFLSGTDVVTGDNTEPFGYQEAWAEYRYGTSRLSGQVRRSFVNRALSPWTYSDYYESRPYLSAEWLFEPRSNVDNTLTYFGGAEARPGSVLPCYWYPYSSSSPNLNDMLVDQFVVDVSVINDAERPLPVYSIPGGDI